jgi:hypothetical protein
MVLVREKAGLAELGIVVVVAGLGVVVVVAGVEGVVEEGVTVEGVEGVAVEVEGEAVEEVQVASYGS